MEVYVLIERRMSAIIKFMTIFLWLLAGGLFLTSCLFIYFLPVSILIAGAAYFVRTLANKEFEYSYFDGEVRFAKIMNKKSRKRLGEFNMDEIMQIAPAGDRSVMRYESDSSVRVRDYTSGVKGAPYYELIVNSQGVFTMIKFEPDDRFLDEVSKRYAQKVIRRTV